MNDCDTLKLDVLSGPVLRDLTYYRPHNFRNALDVALMRNPSCSHARYAAMLRSLMNLLKE